MKWEYKIISASSSVEAREIMLENMNAVGDMEWELVSVCNGAAYFKRPKENITDEALNEMTEQFKDAVERLMLGIWWNY